MSPPLRLRRSVVLSALLGYIRASTLESNLADPLEVCIFLTPEDIKALDGDGVAASGKQMRFYMPLGVMTVNTTVLKCTLQVLTSVSTTGSVMQAIHRLRSHTPALRLS
ncbi:hypothetical protein BDR03DRAFT_969865 [Suillus americanus]|nr:hypothetical protein BDR03DRAFT_969865 [Suillus americanus]